MKKKILLNDYQDHPYRDTINEIGLLQYDLANSLDVPQGVLSHMLRGIAPMPKKVEDAIKTIIDSLQKPKPKGKKLKKK